MGNQAIPETTDILFHGGNDILSRRRELTEFFGTWMRTNGSGTQNISVIIAEVCPGDAEVRSLPEGNSVAFLPCQGNPSDADHWTRTVPLLPSTVLISATFPPFVPPEAQEHLQRFLAGFKIRPRLAILLPRSMANVTSFESLTGGRPHATVNDLGQFWRVLTSPSNEKRRHGIPDFHQGSIAMSVEKTQNLRPLQRESTAIIPEVRSPLGNQCKVIKQRDPPESRKAKAIAIPKPRFQSIDAPNWVCPPNWSSTTTASTTIPFKPFVAKPIPRKSSPETSSVQVTNDGQPTECHTQWELATECLTVPTVLISVDRFDRFAIDGIICTAEARLSLRWSPQQPARIVSVFVPDPDLFADLNTVLPARGTGITISFVSKAVDLPPKLQVNGSRHVVFHKEFLDLPVLASNNVVLSIGVLGQRDHAYFYQQLRQNCAFEEKNIPLDVFVIGRDHEELNKVLIPAIRHRIRFEPSTDIQKRTLLNVAQLPKEQSAADEHLGPLPIGTSFHHNPVPAIQSQAEASQEEE